jgi:hypothetical protein
MNEMTCYEDLPIEKLRDRVIDDLVKHYSLERIDLPEFERRTEVASKTSSRGELIDQVADLPALSEGGRPSQREATAAEARPEGWAVAAGDVKQNDVSVAIFSGSDYKGVWRAPRTLSSLCVFGGSNIDLRKAIVPPEGVTISCLCAFGGADIIVPPGMRVTTRGFGIFGGFDRINNEVDDPEAPTIVVEGFAIFGGVSVKIRD